MSLAEANQASENRQPKPPPIFSKVIPEKAESEVASEIAASGFAGLTASGVRAVNGQGPLSSRKLSGRLRDPSRSERTLMADMKFSCPHCGQHISCDELWSGHQIQCPACQNSLVVPQSQPAASAAAPAPRPQVAQPPTPNRPKLSAGATQVARSSQPAAIPRMQPLLRPPKAGNSLLKYAVIAVVLAVVGGAGYIYLPALLTRIQEMGTSKTAAPASAPAGGRAGPLGEVNEAMDVSDVLDGSSPSKPRAGAPRQPVVVQPPATPATNPAAKSAQRRSH